MASNQPRPHERLAICLTGGLLLAVASAVGFWAGSLAQAVGRAPGLPGGAAAEPRRGSSPVGPATRDDRAASDGTAPGRPAPHGALAGTPTDRGPREPDPARESADRRRASDDRAEDSEADVLAALERLERLMEEGMNRARDSVVALEYATPDSPPGSMRLATGVVINASGDLLSIRIDPPSAAAGASPIVARDASGRRHVVRWVAHDPESGLTLLRIAPGVIKPIVIAPEGPTLGSQVLVVGNPFGLGHSVSRGHIAGLDRALELGHRQVGGLIQVQAPLYPGDSGAVVANLRGQLIGLIRSGLANPTSPRDRSDRESKYGFAIGTRDLLWIADNLRARGKVDRAYLGVRLQPMPPPGFSMPPVVGETPAPPGSEGACLEEVYADTPAARAGLQSGDAIIALNGEPIHSSPDLTDRLDRLPSQSNVQLEVLRGQGPSRKQLRFVLQTTSRSQFERTARAPSAPPAGAHAPAPGPPVQAVSVAPRESDARGPEPTVKKLSSGAPASLIPAVTPASPGPAQPAASVTIPPPARSPLRAPVPPAQAEELNLSLPQVLADRLNQFERRLERLERQILAGPQAQPPQGK
ncbi:MAG: trypsin-like peptidase domain-containing protein [Isosphaeraceae bacterium]